MGSINNLMNKFEAKFAWTAETIDYIKDWVYTIKYKHMFGDSMWLIFSLTFPWAFYDLVNNLPPNHPWGRRMDKTGDIKYFIENTLEYFGFSYSTTNRKSRQIAMIIVKLFEDIPQLRIVIKETFLFGYTVNFV